MPHRHRWSPALVAALAVAAWLAAPVNAQAASVGKELKQCLNLASGTGSCTTLAHGSDPGWTNGTLNSSNSLYRMGDYVPFRAEITGLEAGNTYTLRLGYRAVFNGLHSYDFLGTYNRRSLAPVVIPCAGIGDTQGPHACNGSPDTIAIPRDTNTTFPSGGQEQGVFSTWGATFVRESPPVYVSCSECGPIGVGTGGAVLRHIDVTFTAAGPTVVVAWGGHIASALDWGPARTYAEAGSGAAGFQMFLERVHQEGDGNYSTGRVVRTLMPNATGPLSEMTTQVDRTRVGIGEPVVDTATLAARDGLPVTGSVRFFVCFNATASPDCNRGGTPANPALVTVAPAGNSPNGVASAEYTPGQPGHYCFRAEYLPGNAPYSAKVHTNTSMQQPGAECFEAVGNAPRITVTKLCSPEEDGGLFNLLITPPAGTPFGRDDVACGEHAGPFSTIPGTHQISESAGTGTDLGNYEPPIFGGNCANGSIVVAFVDVTCVITNIRREPGPAPEATLNLTKECGPPATGRFKFLLDDGSQIAELSCGESTLEPIPLAPGTHTVREAGVPPTSLADYTTVITGDCASNGSITLAEGEHAHCTFTNTRIPPTTTLRVDKACFPAGDTSSRFNLTIHTMNGHLVKEVQVGCGSTTGAVKVDAGTFIVGETGAGGTHLGDYDVTIGSACAPDGTVIVRAGEQLTCLITNERKGTPSAELTVAKICIPADDGGRFNLTINGQTSPDVRCGGRFGPVVVSPGQHRVSESAGTGTSLGDYTTSINGRCAADGSVTLAAGEAVTCTITNIRKDETPVTPPPPPEPPPPPPPPIEDTAQITLVKQCTPADVSTRFTLNIGQTLFQNMRCGDSTGPVVVSTGNHAVGEVAVDGLPGQFTTTISGDCSPNGTITLAAGQHATCTVTNARRPVPPPPPRPPAVCYKLTVAPRMVTVGPSVRIVARVHVLGRGVQGVRVYAAGAGVFDVRTTGGTGHAVFLLRLDRPGILRMRIRRPYACPPPLPQKIGVLGALLLPSPSVTG